MVPVFRFPFTPIIEALAEAGIRPIVARQERVAENMADGFSRTTCGERIGVVTVQQSAGAENAFAGIAQAAGEYKDMNFGSIRPSFGTGLRLRLGSDSANARVDVAWGNELRAYLSFDESF